MKRKYKISIITVSLNSEKYIERCIKSVKNQNIQKIKLTHCNRWSSKDDIENYKKFKNFIFF